VFHSISQKLHIPFRFSDIFVLNCKKYTLKSLFDTL
jgi:hypothetical protein